MLKIENEKGVLFLFGMYAKKLGFRIQEIHTKYPDCIALKNNKPVQIEFEHTLSRFKVHLKEDRYLKKCDCIIYWENEGMIDIEKMIKEKTKKKIKFISLKNYLGLGTKVWIQPVIKREWSNLDKKIIRWGLSKKAEIGDLLLMYRCYPEKSIRDVYIVKSKLEEGTPSWREGKCCGGLIERLCCLDSPVTLDDFRNHRDLSNSSFVSGNMQGNLHVYPKDWKPLYAMIIKRNPSLKNILFNFSPPIINRGNDI
jgi:hypothetical protein